MMALCLVFFSVGSARAQEEDPYLPDLKAAQKSLQKGDLRKARYLFDEEILAAFEEEEGEDRPGPAVVRGARQGLCELDLLAGEYAKVIAQVDALPPSEQADRGYATLLVRALQATGEYARVQAILIARVESHPADFEARTRLGMIFEATGKHETARRTFSDVVDASAKASVRDGLSLEWIARAHIALGGRENIEQASALLLEAKRVAPNMPGPRILDGWIRYQAYGNWSGKKGGENSIKEVIRRNGDVEEALLALYRIRRANHLLNPSKTEDYLARALARNRNSVPALMERGIGLIDDRRFTEGIAVLDSALAINPNAREVLAQRIAGAVLVGDKAAEARFVERLQAIDARYPGQATALGDRLVALYRFVDASAAYQKALELDPDDLPALHGLGKALIYSGKGDEARVVLERAKGLQKGFVNPWRHNALAVEDLLGEEYKRVESGAFVFYIHEEDQEVLATYLLPWHEEAFEFLSRKYGYRPKNPIRIEVFHTWDDFSVRTIGFRGFTALGACFGPLITLVSPVDWDLRKNDFMWSATVWHEFTHVLTLALSDNRVPRWLTEGLSVHEEGAKNRAWERGMLRDLLDAYHNEDIPPVRLLNRLFRGPRILFGYYIGGEIVDYLSAEFGFPKVVEFVKGYAQDLSTSQSFKLAFGYSTREFDKRFKAHVKQLIRDLKIVPRYNGRAINRFLTRVARDSTDLDAHVQLAWAFLDQDVRVDAASHLRQALNLDPEYPEAQLVYAELLRRRASIEEAIARYEKGFKGRADDFMSRIRYGAVLEKLKDYDGAARQYLAAKRCWPNCTDQALAPELKLAKLYMLQGMRDESMMELKTYCKRTARAFDPRLRLAAFERSAGNRKQEAQLLEEAIQIDPFVRSVHVELGECYVALGRKADAVREFRVALAVPPALDRVNLGKKAADQVKAEDPAYREQQAIVCLRLARILRSMSKPEEAIDFLDRAIAESPKSAAASEAEELRAVWR